jgi:1-acyl-sn-glycerol-3-phosphate acyltransferase
MLRLLLVAVFLGFYFLMAPFGYSAFLLLHLFPARDPDRRARLLQAIMRGAFALMHRTLRLIGLLDFDPRSLRGKLPDGPCVVVANHPSLVDVAAIMSAARDVTTAVKSTLYNKWWLRPLVSDAALFEGSRGDPLDVGRVVEAGVERLHRGFRVLVFPEGTRSPKGSTHTFSRAAFEIACKAKVPIIPIVIHYAPRWLTKDVGFFRCLGRHRSYA